MNKFWITSIYEFEKNMEGIFSAQKLKLVSAFKYMKPAFLEKTAHEQYIMTSILM